MNTTFSVQNTPSSQFPPKTPRFPPKSPRFSPKNGKTLKKGKGKGKGKGKYSMKKGKGKGKGKGAFYKNGNENNENNDNNFQNNTYVPIITEIYTYDDNSLKYAITEFLDKIDTPNDYDGLTPLQHAVKADNTNAIYILLAEGADINATNEKEQTALHTAAAVGKLNFIELLLSLGAIADSENIDGKKPINVAANEGFSKIIPKLPRSNAPAELTVVCTYSKTNLYGYIPEDIFDRLVKPKDFEDTVYDVLSNPKLCVGIDSAFQKSSLDDAQFIITILDESDSVLGFATILFDNINDYFEVDLFCSDYSYKGIGTMLMGVLKRFKTALNKKIKLKSVPEAHNFYLKQGFTNNAGPPRGNSDSISLIPMTYS